MDDFKKQLDDWCKRTGFWEKHNRGEVTKNERLSKHEADGGIAGGTPGNDQPVL